MDAYELKGFLRHGKLIRLPSNRKKRLAALIWLSEYIAPNKEYTEREFNELLNKLHSFEDPATLRRELCDYGLINRSADGSCYWLNPDRPLREELLAEHGEDRISAEYSDRDLESAADFRNRIHAEALKRVQQFRPDITSVTGRYSVYAYFQKIWDYPGAWYTIVAIPESAGSREALIDTIVRDTLAQR